MATIYAVTDGDYSDYRILGLYSTIEKAERAKKLFAAHNDIDEWSVDKEPDGVPAGMFRYSVRMYKDGRVESANIESAEYMPSREWAPYGDDQTVHFDMWATDEKHAIKIANERRLRLIAESTWTTDWDEWRKR